MTKTRVAVVFRDYKPVNEFKDQGMYLRALQLAGYHPLLVTYGNPELLNHQSSDYEIIVANTKDILEGKLWASGLADVVIGFNWLSRHFFHAASDLRRRRVPLLIKADTDGFVSSKLWLGESLRRTMHQAKNGHLNLVSPAKTMARALSSSAFDHRLLQVMDRSSRIIIETSAALSNVKRFIAHYHYDHLINRLCLVWNPVDPLFTTLPAPRDKRPQITLIGRWDDSQKNARHATRATQQFLRRRPNYSAVVAGTGTGSWHRFRKHCPPNIARRLSVRPEVPHADLVGLFSQSRILFSASYTEGSPLSMAEALCCGATVVGTPIPATDDFTDRGRFGTQSTGFHWRNLCWALLQESDLWDAGGRNPAVISNYWITRIELAATATRLNAIIQQSLEEYGCLRD